MQRIMFINNGGATTVSVTTTESVGIFKMLTSGAHYALDYTETLTPPATSITWDLRMAAGGIYGFGVANGATYPSSIKDVEVFVVSGKNPWPQPPPPPPAQFTEVSDYTTRYACFIASLSGDESRQPAPAPAIEDRPAP